MAQNILLIQDDPEDAKAVREALVNSGEGTFQVEWVRSCSEGLQRLAVERKQEKQRADGIAAVLVDLFLPDSHGMATFDRLYRAAPQIPILVLSETQDEDVAKLAVQNGAQDYLLKARLDGYLLPKTLGSMVERAARTPSPNSTDASSLVRQRNLRVRWISTITQEAHKEQGLAPERDHKSLIEMVGRRGIEPRTNGLRVRCSTS
jgi:DNA-binding response OmpR family regulator